jgi:hypothetical protein
LKNKDKVIEHPNEIENWVTLLVGLQKDKKLDVVIEQNSHCDGNDGSCQ